MTKQTPYQRQFYYMQVVGQINKYGELLVNTKYNEYLQEEWTELSQATKESNIIEIADALGDILVCIMGCFIENKIKESDLPYCFSAPFIYNEKYYDILTYHNVITQNPKHILIGKLTNSWQIILLRAVENNIDIEGVFNTICDNNLARIQKDEKGKAMLDENGKTIKIKDFPKPDLSKFIL